MLENTVFVEEFFPKKTSLEPYLQRGLRLPPELSQAVHKRKLEFLAGRFCAVEALKKLGAKKCTQPRRAPSGAPLFPQETVGSITHTDGYAACIAGRRSDLVGVGIDAEHLVEQTKYPALVKMIFQDSEWKELQEKKQPHMSEAELFTVGFSAKESLYKCLFPVVKTFFGFHDARLILKEENFFITLCIQNKKFPALKVQVARKDDIFTTAVCLLPSH